MYEIIPTVKQDPKAVKKPIIQHIKDVMSGTTTHPFGFYDFVIVGTASFFYFFFTGIAVARGKPINPKWLSIGYKINGGKVISGIKKKVIKEPETVPNSIKVETINKPIPQPFT